MARSWKVNPQVHLLPWLDGTCTARRSDATLAIQKLTQATRILIPQTTRITAKTAAQVLKIQP